MNNKTVYARITVDLPEGTSEDDLRKLVNDALHDALDRMCVREREKQYVFTVEEPIQAEGLLAIIGPGDIT